MRECGAADAIFTEGVEKPSSVGQRACRINPDRRDFERLHHAAESAFAAPDVECAPKAAPTDPFDHRSVEHETAAKVGVSAERSDPRLGRVVPRGGDARAVLRREAVSRCLHPDGRGSTARTSKARSRQHYRRLADCRRRTQGQSDRRLLLRARLHSREKSAACMKGQHFRQRAARLEDRLTTSGRIALRRNR